MRGIRSSVRSLCGTLCVLLLCLVCGVKTSAFAAEPFVALGDALSPLLTHGKVQLITPPSSESPLPVTLVFRPRQMAAYEVRVTAMSNPASPLYHRAVSDAKYESDFAPDAALYDQAQQYLQEQGLTIVARSTNRLTLSARGLPHILAAAFHTDLGYFRTAAGLSDYSILRAPQLPARLAYGVEAIVGLDRLSPFTIPIPTVTRMTPALSAPAPNTACTPVDFFGHGAADFQSGYNIDGLHAAGMRGAGQNIGIVLWQIFDQNHLDRFSDDSCLPRSQPEVIGSGFGNDQIVEPDLDVQMIHAIAPDAHIVFYLANSAWSSDVVTALNAAASDTRLTAISNSWGICEAAVAPSQLDALHTIILTAASHNTTVLAASGDSGIYDCKTIGNPVGDGAPGNVISPGSDPAVTAVGGTTRSLTAAAPRRWLSESGWSCTTPGDMWSCIQGIGGSSGGGQSGYFARPDYQQGVTNALGTDRRTIPDISLTADPQDSLAVYTSIIQDYQYTGYVYAGGTSAASPLLAGILALVAQQDCFRPGALNPFLYQAGQSSAWLYDVTAGWNGAQAGPGYDLVTGVGSLKDGGAFAAALAPPGPCLTATPQSLTFEADLNGPDPAAQTLAVRNTLPAPVTSWSVTVSTADGGAWLSATPTAGTDFGTIAVQVTHATLATGAHAGTVTLTPTTPTVHQASFVVPVTLVVTDSRLPSLVLSAESPPYCAPYCAPGDSLPVSYAVFNNSLIPLTNVSLSAQIGSGLVFAPETARLEGAAGYASGDGGWVMGHITALPAGERARFKFHMSVDALGDGGRVATVAVQATADAVPPATLSTPLSISEPQVSAVPAPALTLALRSMPDGAIVPHQYLKLAITLTNTTPHDLAQVMLTLPLPALLNADPLPYVMGVSGGGAILVYGKSGTSRRQAIIRVPDLPVGQTTLLFTTGNQAIPPHTPKPPLFKVTARANPADNPGLHQKLVSVSNAQSIVLDTQSRDSGLGGRVQMLTLNTRLAQTGHTVTFVVSGGSFALHEPVYLVLVDPAGQVIADTAQMLTAASRTIRTTRSLHQLASGRYTCLAYGLWSDSIAVASITVP